MRHHDIVIIGSGSGNSIFTPELEDRDIALVEENTHWFGGTCLNVGCIPTKMFVYPAGIAESVHADADRLGIDAHVDGVRWAEIRDRIFGRIDPISSGGRDYRSTGTPNGTLYETHASFQDKHTLALGTGETITTDQIVIATGSRPVVPAMITESGVPFHTSDTVMRIDELPRRVIIVGGGYISAEFAHVFSAYGAEVSIVARSSHLLRHLDIDISERFTEQARSRWDVHLDVELDKIEHAGPGGPIRLLLSDGQTVEGDLLLVAAGRTPNTDRLDLPRSGVEVHMDGRIVVDEYQRTNVANVWALGDAANPYQLKHVANHEAKIVAHNLAHPDELEAADHRFVPAAVFTHPQLASVGLTEQKARARGVRFVSAVHDYGSVAYGWAMEDTVGVCKVIADPDSGLLLGAHLMGEQASTLIQPLIQAMSFGLGAREMARGQYWIHPALTEVVENTLLKLPLA